MAGPPPGPAFTWRLSGTHDAADAAAGPDCIAQSRTNAQQFHFDYGSALLHQHKYPEAQAELIKALQLKPDLD
jgi:hypothetical protein